MPVWLTFFGSLFGVFAFFGGMYFLIVTAVEGWRAKSAPRFGVAKGNGSNVLNIWVKWDPKQFALEVYRLRFQHLSPFDEVKEGTFTITFDAPQKEPFVQPVEIPASFAQVFTASASARNLFTAEFKTVDETTMCKEYRVGYIRKILNGMSVRLPHIGHILPLAKADHPSILSLDHSEVTARRSRLKDLEAAAKAKAAKAAAVPAKPAAPAAVAKPVPAAAPAAPPVEAVAKAPAPEAVQVAPAPQEKTPVAAPSDQPVKSVRDVVSANNKKQVEKP